MSRNGRLVRSQDRWLGGVCGGLADYFGWDANLVRLLYVAITVVSAGFLGILLYIILWILMPNR